MRYAPTWLTDAERTLQAEVRTFLAAELPPGSYTPALGMSGARNPEFSRKLAERGWIGMALPRQYGGGERSLVERFVVVEELLRWGAPVGFHWTADRQSGPNINRFGTETQRELLLPGICRGELSFAIGMSEPDAGSDLSAVRTAATRTDGGWLLNGTKVWTSGARGCDWLIVLARTSKEDRPQAGLTQFLVDRRDPAVSVRPIRFIDNTEDFCEVVLRDLFVPDELVLGSIGGGWAQNTAELAFERGGPDRILSTFGVMRMWLASGVGVDDPGAHEFIGGAVAMYWVLRGLSLSVARMADSGRSPVAEAALVKEMATRFEQDVTAGVADHYGRSVSLGSESELDRLLARAILVGPSFTIRGGTNEILRTVVARELTRGDHPTVSRGLSEVDDLLVETAGRIFADTCGPPALVEAEETGWAEAAWHRAAEAGLPWLGLPEELGGPGGTLLDAVEVLYLAGRHAVPLPLAETGLLGGWLLGQVGHALPPGPLAVVPGEALDTVRLVGSRLRGDAYGVAWPGAAEAIVALLTDGSRTAVVVARRGAWRVESGTNLAGEPRGRVNFDDAEVTVVPTGLPAWALRQRGALSRVALIAGALAAASELTIGYTAQRVQFGRSINKFQAVQHHLVTLQQQAVLARMALDLAAHAVSAGDQSGVSSGAASGNPGEGTAGSFEVAAAAVVAARAAAEGARAAHQAHGAMGMTREYPLQHLTRRLWSWRTEYLSAQGDARRLGRVAVEIGPDRLYPSISGAPTKVEW